MKYGEKLQEESVPQWRLHNVDYDSLKHYIKVNTTRDQATAIAIPGQPDTALRRFEDNLYAELRAQHDRVDLFVASKADELSRRLQHLSDQIHALILRTTTGNRARMSLKRQRRFARYERELIECADELSALSRFRKAQVVAFRKILKKYKKWTGSTSLTSRFNETVLSDPKSFSRRDFSGLRGYYEELLATLRRATPEGTPGTSTPVEEEPPGRNRTETHGGTEATQFQPPSQQQQHQQPYWNEYDYGSEAGDFDGGDSYAIYINPDDDAGFPGMATLVAIFAVPVGKVRGWLKPHGRGGGKAAASSAEHRRLLTADSTLSYDGTASSHLASPTDASGSGGSGGGSSGGGMATDTEADTDVERAYASSEEFPAGYEGHYAALPSINDQRVARYRERMLFAGTLGSFVAAFVLLGVAAVLIATGRHRLRAEVDAGVAVGIVGSLGFACAALGLSVARRDRVGWLNQLVVWFVFACCCVLNGMVLVLMMGNTAL